MNERLRKIRKEKSLNQEDFGKRLGVGKTAISKMELGTYQITDTMAKLICSEFGVNEIWLRTGEGGDENMFTKIPEDDRFALNLGKLGRTENDFIKNGINYLAESEPEKLKVIEEFMKACLGIK
ncbi:MAG: helix-turn-helix domain-containing protein [Lachnospiraceae bacterium]|nr:helix-turn-helix domain-containing protein [Lachnospiraceae bacterium]